MPNPTMRAQHMERTAYRVVADLLQNLRTPCLKRFFTVTCNCDPFPAKKQFGTVPLIICRQIPIGT